jgi:solute carrier family 25 citrate transporter 1
MSVELSNTQNALMGSFGSTIEVLIQHPLITYKNALQANRKLNPCIKSIYKGVSINALTMGPLTAVQFAGYGYFYKFFEKRNTIQNHELRSMISSTISGTLSGFIAGPAELIIVQQQKTDKPFMSLMKYMKKKYGYQVIPKGTISCMGREAIYTAGMCSLTPILEGRLLTSFPSIYKKKSVKSSLTASIGSGLICGTISHPFDTIKTHIQNYPNINSFRATRTLLHTEGWTSLFKGIVPRSIRIIGTFFIINECNRFYIKNILPKF